MSEQVIEVAESTEVKEPATASSAMPTLPACACPTGAPVAPADELSAASGPAVVRLWMGLPQGLRLVLGVGLWAIVYHFWLPFTVWLFHGVLQLPDTRWASSLEFFVYDSVKVLLLLTLVVFGVGVVRSFFSPERTRALLHGRREATGNVMAASLGIVTPFCSCSAVPLFIGFVEAGIPLGVTFSFLIAAPMVNEIALVLLYGLFGWHVAALYLVTGLLIAMVAGWVIGRLKMERYVQDWVMEIRMGEAACRERVSPLGDARELRLAGGQGHRRQGVALGARRHRSRRLIHGYVPQNFMASIMGAGTWWSVPLAVLLGIPMYSNAAGIIPIVQALLEKGAALGTVLAFMMSVIALSLPETIILKKVLKWQLIAVFLGVVGVGIMFVGFFFNAVL